MTCKQVEENTLKTQALYFMFVQAFIETTLNKFLKNAKTGCVPWYLFFLMYASIIT